MVAMQRERTAKSQIGYQVNSTSTYQEGGGDINFANGQLIFVRIPTSLPPGAIINSAILYTNMVVKDGATGQSSSNRIRAHASGDSPALRLGVNEWSNGPRPETSAYSDWTAVWPANPPGDVYLSPDVRSIVQELVNRSDWQYGGYITFIIWNMDETGSDMGIRANNDFVPSPKLILDYTEPDTDVKYTINRCENSEFSSEAVVVRSAGDTNTVPYWGQNQYYGAFVDPATSGGSLIRDTSFTRTAGIPTMKFTCGTPDADTNKRTGPMTAVANWRSDDPFIFCGWIYVSSAVPISSELWIADPYQGQSGVVVSDRNKWVPFCTNPLAFPGDTSWATRWPAVGLKNFQAGWQFWISEPAFISSPFKQMPFNGLTPEPKESGGIVVVDHRSSATKLQSSRVWLPRTAVIRSGTLKRVARYSKRPDGILQLAEPIKGGPSVSNLPATAISSYPAGKTIAEL